MMKLQVQLESSKIARHATESILYTFTVQLVMQGETMIDLRRPSRVGPRRQPRLNDYTRIRSSGINFVPSTRIDPTWELWSAERSLKNITP
jgi:hypothetical protein